MNNMGAIGRRWAPANVRLIRMLAQNVGGQVGAPEAAERTGLTEAGARGRSSDWRARASWSASVAAARSAFDYVIPTH
jgi:hypothetical protein